MIIILTGLNASIQRFEEYIKRRFEEYIKKNRGRLTTATIKAAGNMRTNRKQQKLENRNGKKNKCMDTSNEKLV